MKQWVMAVLALLLLGCEAALPVLTPEPDHLVADIAKLNADYTACLQRENVLLREKKEALDAEIDKALDEAVVLAHKASLKSKRQP